MSEVDDGSATVYATRPVPMRSACTAHPWRSREQLAALAATGATHLLLNPVTRYSEQLEALAEIVSR